jgi:GT2 family glycosyltransferase
MLAGDYPDAIFVQSRQNLGFARANNLGAERASGAVLLFLNPDTVVLNRAIERLYRAFVGLQDPGVVGCRLLNSDGTLQMSCVQAFPTVINQLLDADVLRKWFPKANLWGNAVLAGNKSAPAEVEVISGACMMLRRQVFEIIGRFDSEFFMYGEDLHLCFKTRQAGFLNYHVGNAEIVHHCGGSSQKAKNDFSTVMMCESVSRVLLKSRGKFYSECYRVVLSCMAVGRLLLLIALSLAGLLLPMMPKWKSSFGKWVSILGWGFGLKKWAARYGQIEAEVSQTTVG